MKTKKISFFLLFGLAFISGKAQTLYLRSITGIQTAYPVANIKNLTFSNGNIVIINSIGANGVFSLSDIRYFNFTDLTLGTVSHQIVNNNFYVYPNPTATFLNVGNDDASQTISNLEIISLEGRVLMEQNTPQVEIASLPTGMYFCKITSNNKTQNIKFLKQ
jgi:hypothetical protein